MKQKITKDTIIADAVKLNPEAPEIMFRYGLHCIGCHISMWETIGMGCTAHGMDNKTIDKMVAELNGEAKKPKAAKKTSSKKAKKQ